MILTVLFKNIGLTALIVMLGQNLAEAKTYRWVDDQGKTHFSDKVPPDQVKYERETLNKNAQVTEKLNKAKSQEEYEKEQNMEALRKEQEALISRENAEDRVLLSTYRSVDDLNLTLNGRMQALDAQRRVAEGNLKRLQRQLESQQKKAAELERNGQAVTKGLLEDIRSSEQQIKLSTGEISNHINKKNQIKAEFETNIERFKHLTKSQSTESVNATDAVPIAELEGLFNCTEQVLCDKAWEHSKSFVKHYSTTRITSSTDQLILSNEPVKENDLSLSVSRMQIGTGQQKLFLDIRCHHSRIGAELCASKTAAGIRSAFKPYLEAAIK
ncbi:MAG: DUF4124 domain-containing protein [Methylococcaceae bacterium]|nr:DUF4124 domain-containing protein [Methylococcaceae bacterium]